MVKFGKKFFFEDGKSQPIRKSTRKTKAEKIKERSLALEKIKYYSKKMIPFILLIILVFGILLLTKTFTNKKKSAKSNNKEEEKLVPKIIDTIKIRINEEVPGIEGFVKNYDKVKTETDSITYDTNNFANNTYTAVGEYKVVIKINEKEYSARLIVKDTEAPVYALKDVTITEGSSYTINDFIQSCVDNSGKDCLLDYANIDSSRYTNPGTYEIKIIAKDLSGNKADVKTAKLTINAKPSNNNNNNNNKNNNNKKTTPTCEFGSSEIAAGKVLSYNVSKDNCAIDPEYSKTSTYITIPNKAAREEYEKLKTDLTNANITLKAMIEYDVLPVFNKAGTGLVGYETTFTIKKVTDECTKTSADGKKGYDNCEVVVKYNLTTNNKRSFSVNKLNLQ